MHFCLKKIWTFHVHFFLREFNPILLKGSVPLRKFIFPLGTCSLGNLVAALNWSLSPQELALQRIQLGLSLSLLLLKESPFLWRELACHEAWLKLLLSPLLIRENLFFSAKFAPFWTWLGLKFSILLPRELGQATTYSPFP